MKRHYLLLMACFFFSLGVGAQGFVVHETNNNNTVYSTNDVSSIEFVEGTVDTSTSSYALKTELQDALNRITELEKGLKALTRKLDAVIPSTGAVIDLGLSVNWCPYNIGATSPEECGAYYAWGEVKEKGDYSRSTYFDSGYETYHKDGDMVLKEEHDVAHVIMGGTWRIPTKAEFEELRDKCMWTLTYFNGVKGYHVVGPSGKSIFLPSAGFKENLDTYQLGEGCHYWSSTLEEHSLNAWYLYSAEDYRSIFYKNRYAGCTVRPVCPKR